MDEPPRTTYDDVPYSSHPYPQTTPNRLATVATLLGLRPPAIQRCRVLELGCASGGNLIPMALHWPEAQFIGIDLSCVQIAEGREKIEKLGLKNIRLEQRSIVDVPESRPTEKKGKAQNSEGDLGKFDYIICHGVYSWVSDRVQEKILDICARNLSPHGVAYVSYNTYPGWHMRGMIRDMLGYHAAQFVGSTMKVKQARNLLDFLAKAVNREQSPYSMLLKTELDAFHRSSDSYLFHEHLEEYNSPLYFFQFAERVAAKGLRYLGETDFRVMVPGNYPPEIQSVLHMLAQDQIHLEQYMDFLRNRMFRQTLLCHKNLNPVYHLRPELMDKIQVASPARAMSEKPDLASDQPEKFETPDGLILSASEPLVKAAMLLPCERWPRSMPFKQLAEESWKKWKDAGPVPQPTITLDSAAGDPGSSPLPVPVTAAPVTQKQFPPLDEASRTLAQALLNFYASASTSLLEFSLFPWRFAVEVTTKPTASPLARLQVEHANHATNLRHETVWLTDLERHVVRHLDGTRDVDALLPILKELVESEELHVEKDGIQLSEGPDLEETLLEAVQQALRSLARKAMLVPESAN